MPRRRAISAGRRVARSTRLTAGALVVLVALAAYAPSLRNGYTFDDIPSLRNNPFFAHNQILPDLFGPEYFRMTSEVTYRPLVTASYVLDHFLWTVPMPAEAGERLSQDQFARFRARNLRQWALGLHATNIILHGLNSLLAFMLVRRLAGTRAALIAGLLFALHPAHAEPINAAGFREDLLAASFVLAGTLVFLGRPTPMRAAAATACYALGLLSKESAAMMPPVLFLAERILGDRKKPLLRAALPYTGFAVVATIYVLVRFGPMYSPVETATTYPGGSLWTGLLTALPTLMRYFRLLTFPVGLRLDYDIAPSLSLLEPVVLGSAAGLALAAWAIYRLRRRWPLAAAGLVWYFLMLLPTCNILPIPNIMDERYLYLPSVGLFAAVAALGLAARRALAVSAKPRLALLCMLTLVCFGGLGVRRTSDWRHRRALGQSTVRWNPNSTRELVNLGNLYAEMDVPHLSEGYYRLAVARRPAPAAAHAQLGQVLARLGRAPEAERAYAKALAIDPRDEAALNGLGLLAVSRHQYRQAAEIFRRAARLTRSADAKLNLGIVLSRTGAHREAEAILVDAAKRSPHDPTVRTALGNLYFRTDRCGKALEQHRKALDLSPGAPRLLMNIGADLADLGNQEAAASYFLRALRAEPRLAEARYNLALSLVALGRHDEARQHFVELLRHNPHLAEGLYGLARIVALHDRQPQGAIPLLRRVQRVSPDEPKSAALLGWCLAQTGAAGHGVDVLQRACEELQTDAEAWTWLLSAAQSAGRQDVAHRARQHLLNPGSPAERNSPAPTPP